jgi:hypothetical protein
MRPCTAYRLALSRYIHTKLRTRVSSFTKQTTRIIFGIFWLQIWTQRLVLLTEKFASFIRSSFTQNAGVVPQITPHPLSLFKTWSPLACLHPEDRVSTFLHRVGTCQYAYCVTLVSQKTTDVLYKRIFFSPATNKAFAWESSWRVVRWNGYFYFEIKVPQEGIRDTKTGTADIGWVQAACQTGPPLVLGLWPGRTYFIHWEMWTFPASMMPLCQCFYYSLLFWWLFTVCINIRLKITFIACIY